MKHNQSKKTKKAVGAKAATARSTKPRTAPKLAKSRKSITARVASKAFHDLVHEIDEDDHMEGKGDPVTRVRMPGFHFGCTGQQRSSTGEILVRHVFIGFDKQHCVIRSHYQVPGTLFVDQNRGATPTPEEELRPSEPAAVIEYDDPALLKKAFKALAELGVEVPRKLTTKIRQCQETLSSGK